MPAPKAKGRSSAAADAKDSGKRKSTGGRSKLRVSDGDLLSPGSPGWVTGNVALFKTPKSPSPKKRMTRRSSVYQKKDIQASKIPMKAPVRQTCRVSAMFKQPKASKGISCPVGMVTRARRSSIYQKSGRPLLPMNLLSPSFSDGDVQMMTNESRSKSPKLTLTEKSGERKKSKGQAQTNSKVLVKTISSVKIESSSKSVSITRSKKSEVKSLSSPEITVVKKTKRKSIEDIFVESSWSPSPKKLQKTSRGRTPANGGNAVSVSSKSVAKSPSPVKKIESENTAKISTKGKPATKSPSPVKQKKRTITPSPEIGVKAAPVIKSPSPMKQRKRTNTPNRGISVKAAQVVKPPSPVKQRKRANTPSRKIPEVVVESPSLVKQKKHSNTPSRVWEKAVKPILLVESPSPMKQRKVGHTPSRNTPKVSTKTYMFRSKASGEMEKTFKTPISQGRRERILTDFSNNAADQLKSPEIVQQFEWKSADVYFDTEEQNETLQQSDSETEDIFVDSPSTISLKKDSTSLASVSALGSRCIIL